MNWFKNIFGKPKNFKIPKRYNYLEGRDPSKPINFGIKTMWCAVLSTSNNEVVDFLKINAPRKCDWLEGTIRAYEGDYFVLPPINNWVLIHSRSFSAPEDTSKMHGADKLLNALSNEFNEAHLYGNHRVSSFACWMKSTNGEITRMYTIGDGTYSEIGKPIGIEKKWNLINMNSDKIEMDDYWDSSLFPGEKEVLDIAGDWSFNPMKIESLNNISPYGIIGSRIKY